ncbi:unnamed protein product, partial [Rotaria sp. Silwood2]
GNDPLLHTHPYPHPFVVDHDSNNLKRQQQSGLHRQTTNTSSYRRRQRRVRQQKYRNTADNYDPNYNQFTELSEVDAYSGIELR